MRARRAAPLWLAIAATTVGLTAGYLLKAQCTWRAWIDDYQYERLCYNDIQPLFGARGIAQGLLPYRDPPADRDAPVRPVEYPVLTGTFMDATGRLLRQAFRVLPIPTRWYGDEAYFNLSAILLAPFAFATTLVLRRHVPRARLMLWALGSPMVLYAFHNWDLLTVAGGVAGIVWLERGRNVAAGAALGLGASAKLFPAFLLPGALLARLALRDEPGAARTLSGFVGAAALANVPWVIVSWRGWLEVWAFHARRYPDFGTVWYWIAHHGGSTLPTVWWQPGNPGYRDLVGRVSALAFASGSILFLWRGWRRRHEPGGYPVAAVGLGIVCLFLLVSKVHSPQYALWVLPLLALLDVPWRLVGLYLAADLAVYVSGFYWFTVLDAPAPNWRAAFEWSVWARALALAMLAWWAWRARRVTPDAAEAAVVGRPRAAAA